MFKAFSTFIFVLQIELVCRVCTFLVQIHYNQLLSTLAARLVLSELEEIYPRVKVIVMLHIRTEKFYYVI